MSEIYYDVTLLCREEDEAVSLFKKMNDSMDAAEHELIKLVNRCCGAEIDSHGYEYDIEHCKLFRNEFRISTYTGRSSEYPVDIIAPLMSVGCQIARIAVMYEDSSRWESRWFVDGKKSTKKKYEQQFRQYKVEDETDQLQRLLTTNKFKQAAEIIDHCDLRRIVPEADFIFQLICARGKHDGLAIKLVQAGLLDKPDKLYKTPWIALVAESGSSALLAACLERGMDPYDRGEMNEYTALHMAAGSGSERAVERVQTLIKACGENLSPVTKLGSPTWYGHEQKGNVAGCLLLRDAGARIIPPENFYDELDERTTVIEAVKHCDTNTLNKHFTPNFHDVVVFNALHYQCYEIVKWANDLEKIDWTSKFGGEAGMGADDLEAFYAKHPLYEQPFFFSTDGPGYDPRLVEHIVESVEPRVEILSRLLLYISGIKEFPSGVRLLDRLLSLGADIDTKRIIDNDEYKTTPIERSLWHECFDNFEFLLQAGADTSPRAFLEEATIEEAIQNCEAPARRRAKSIWKKYAE